MKKRILLVLLLILTALSFTSCNFFDNTVKTDPKLNYSYTQKQEDEIIAEMDLFANELSSLSQEDFEIRWNKINTEINNIATYSNLASLKNNLYGDDISSDDYLRFSELLNKLLDKQNEILNNIYNSQHKDYFFSDYTEEEIKDIIDNKYNSQYYELTNRSNELITEYTLLDTTADDWEIKVDQIYIELISVYNEMAKLLNYSNYMEYAYNDVYDRDYSISDAKIFSEFVSKYIVKEYEELRNSIKEKLPTYKYSSIMTYNNFYSNFYEKNMFYFEKYANYVGGEYLSSYEKAWKNDSYVFFGASASMPAAYTTYIYNANQPAMYFGYGYQDIMTVVHETGHYYAADLIDGMDFPLDLAEVHSQANEMLFLDFIEQNYLSDFYTEGMFLIHVEQLLNAFSTIIISTIVNDFEILVYEEKNLTVDKLDDLFIQACIPYGGVEYLSSLFGGYDITKYWRNVCLDNAGYYISYAMSLIPSLDLYTIGKTDLKLAVEKYLSLCSSEEDFLKTLEISNLSNPFNEEVYINICNLYN